VRQTIQISEESAALLAQQAAAHGKSLEAWIEELAHEKARTATTQQKHVERDTAGGRSLVEQMRELRSRVKPDPEGWTVKDYIDHGRR
jgi:hypothetical protein